MNIGINPYDPCNRCLVRKEVIMPPSGDNLLSQEFLRRQRWLVFYLSLPLLAMPLPFPVSPVTPSSAVLIPASSPVPPPVEDRLTGQEGSSGGGIRRWRRGRQHLIHQLGWSGSFFVSMGNWRQWGGRLPVSIFQGKHKISNYFRLPVVSLQIMTDDSFHIFKPLQTLNAIILAICVGSTGSANFLIWLIVILSLLISAVATVVCTMGKNMICELSYSLLFSILSVLGFGLSFSLVGHFGAGYVAAGIFFMVHTALYGVPSYYLYNERGKEENTGVSCI